jgi:hypothetical protein
MSWYCLPIALIAYTTEFLNVVEEETWIFWWKNWKKTTRITTTREGYSTLVRRVNRVLHSLADICAIVWDKKEKEWWCCGSLHRNEDKPAFESENGTKYWYWYGKRHREGDKPAVKYASGTKEWWRQGNLHRDGDKPAVERANGTKEWWWYGKRHREGNKPAIEQANGSKEWWCRDILIKNRPEPPSLL